MKSLIKRDPSMIERLVEWLSRVKSQSEFKRIPGVLIRGIGAGMIRFGATP